MRRGLLISTGLCALALGACGSEKPPLVVSSVEPTPWATRAEMICEDARTRARRIARQVRRAVPDGGAQRAIELARRQRRLDADRLVELRRLVPAEEEEEPVAGLLGLLEVADETVGPMADVAATGDRTERAALEQRLRSLSPATRGAAGALRVPACVPEQLDG